jgi:hypothetical protein
MTNITQGFVELGYKQAACCRENPEVYLESMIKFPSQRAVMFQVYNSLRQSGKIKAVELLPESERREIWEEAKKLANGRLPKEKLIPLSKILYALNYLLQTS